MPALRFSQQQKKYSQLDFRSKQIQNYFKTHFYFFQAGKVPSIYMTVMIVFQ